MLYRCLSQAPELDREATSTASIVTVEVCFSSVFLRETHRKGCVSYRRINTISLGILCYHPIKLQITHICPSGACYQN
jgi:3-dehydroquinate dehydratase